MNMPTIVRPEDPARSQDQIKIKGRATLRGHLAIMRIDHWVKQVFVLPGIVAALSDGTDDIPGGLVVPPRRRHARRSASSRRATT